MKTRIEQDESSATKTKTPSWFSKSIRTVAALALATAAFASIDTAKAVTFDYSNTPGSAIHFAGGVAHTFNFTPGANNFQVTSGTASTLLGEMTGVFTIGAIVGFSADVTGVGTFVIHDGAFDLTATLEWRDLLQMGIGGNLNTFGTVNLTNIMYTGTNADLVALRDALSGSNTLTFQFAIAGGVTLSELSNGNSRDTSFSGTIIAPIAVPDGGTTVVLLGLVLIGMEGLRRRIWAAK